MDREALRIVDTVRLGLLMLVTLGFAISDAQVDAVVAFVGAAVGLAGLLGVTEWLRARLTPVSAPQLPEGTKVTVTDAMGEPTSTQTLR